MGAALDVETAERFWTVGRCRLTAFDDETAVDPAFDGETAGNSLWSEKSWAAFGDETAVDSAFDGETAVDPAFNGETAGRF